MRRIVLAAIILLSCAELAALPRNTKAGRRPVGRMIWKFRVGYRAYLSAANEVLYIASPTGCTDYVPCGPPARLIAVDGRTGTQKWKLEDIGDDSAPVIANGVIYQAAGGSLAAVNARTGRVEWSFEGTTGLITHSPGISRGTIFFWEIQALIPLGVFGGTLHAVDLKTREEKWRYSTDHGVVHGPVVDDDMVYFGTTADSHQSKGSLCALDARTGRVRWEFDVAGPSPAARRGLVFFAGQDGIVYALDSHTGRKVWQFKSASGFGSPYVVADRLVYFILNGQYGLRLYAVDPTTGRQKWEFKADGITSSAPVIAKDIVYVGSIDHLYALDAKTGRRMSKFKVGGSAASSPVVSNGTVYVVNSDGYVYALK